MTEFCGVHLTAKENGVCRWCQGSGVFDSFDGRDDRLRSSYNKTTGLVAKSTSQDEQVATYEDPWAPAFFQPYMDFQRAPGPHTLEHRATGWLVESHWEWGGLEVRGSQADALRLDVIGYLVLGVDENGDPTAALVGSPEQQPVPFDKRNG